MCDDLQLGHTAQKNTFKCTKGNSCTSHQHLIMYTHTIPGEENGKEKLSPYILHLHYKGRGRRSGRNLRLAPFFFYANRLQEVAEQNAARASRLQELYTFFCLLVGWCTKKLSLGDSISRFLSSYSWEHCSFSKLLRAICHELCGDILH